MHVLIADDDAVTRRLLQAALQAWGHEVIAVGDGDAAWESLQADDVPELAILDWQMPGCDGVQLCRRVRAQPRLGGVHILLLTARTGRENVIEALEAGADDYVTKPFDPGELRARVQVAQRLADLQRRLADRVHELEAALTRVKQLQGLLPICSYCKKIRDDHNYWQGVEHYLIEHSEARFSHGICPACYDSVVIPEMEARYGKLPPAR